MTGTVLSVTWGCSLSRQKWKYIINNNLKVELNYCLLVFKDSKNFDSKVKPSKTKTKQPQKNLRLSLELDRGGRSVKFFADPWLN